MIKAAGNDDQNSTIRLERPGTTPNVAKAYSQTNDGRNLGQGSEIDSLDPILADLWDAHGTNNYHASFHEGANTALAGFYDRFLGLPANKDNSLFLQQPGRNLLLYAFMAVADSARNKEYKPKVLMPNKRWSVINGLLKHSGLSIVEYDIFDKNPARAMKNAVKECENPEQIVAYYMCSPNNPTGRHYSDAEFADVRNFITAENNKIVGIHDDPYFPACVQNEPGVYPILNTGYDAVATPLTGGNPEIILTSFAKGFQKAQRGEGGAFVSDPALMKTYQGVAAIMGGLSYNAETMNKRAKALGTEYEGVTRSHFAKLADKYTKNWQATAKEFNIVAPSGPNMTHLIEISKEVLGKMVTYANGTLHTIADGDDFVQFLMNRKETVGIVYDGFAPNGNLSFRLASKNVNADHVEGLKRLKDGYNEALSSTRTQKVESVPKIGDGSGMGG